MHLDPTKETDPHIFGRSMFGNMGVEVKRETLSYWTLR